MSSPNSHAGNHCIQAQPLRPADGSWPARQKPSRHIRDLFATIGTQDNLGDTMEHLVDGLVRFFDAESCVVDLLQQGQVTSSKPAPLGIIAGAPRSGPRGTRKIEAVLGHLLESKTSIILPHPQATGGDGDADAGASRGHAMVSPIVAGDTVLGLVTVTGPVEERPFDGDDLHLLDTITLYLGQAIHARCLRDLLDSRLLHLAIGNEPERSSTQVRVGSVPTLDKMTRIVARSFYREMTKAGFGSHQIITAATEIISELHSNLKDSCRGRDEYASDCARP